MALGSVTAKTTGVRELDRMFRKMQLKVKEKELRKGHRAAGRILVKAEREEWHKNHGHNSTGATERSIGTIQERRPGKGQIAGVAVGPIRRRDRSRSGYKAWWHEVGTVKMGAKPSFGPAWERVKDIMEKVISGKLAGSITRTMRRNAKRL